MRMTITSRVNRGSRLAGVAAVAIGITLVLAGCGSDDGSDDNSSSSDNAAASEDAGNNDPDGDTSEDSGSDDGASDDSGAGGDTGEYCQKLSQLGQNFLSDAGAAVTDPEVAADLSAQIREIAEVAPSDVTQDWSTLADALETLSTIDMTDPESTEDLQQLSADLQGASQRLATETTEACN